MQSANQADMQSALSLGALATITPGTGVATALAINTGTAGSILVNGGALGAPSSGVLTSCTGLPLSTGITGTLAVANGGTGITSFGTGVATALGQNVTGSGGIVLDTGATLTAPITITGVAGSSALTVNGATQTTSKPVLNLTQTWNAGAVTFSGILLNVTDTASNAASLLLDLQVGGTSQLRITKAGTIYLNSGSNGAYLKQSGGHVVIGSYATDVCFFVASTAYGLEMASTMPITWGSGGINSSDLYLYRDAAATLQMGADHATTATAQTLKAHDVTTGTGASICIAGGKGSTAGGAVKLATSATTGAPTVVVTVKASGVVNIANLPTSSVGLSTGDLYQTAGALMVA